jgi:hypothetical protein
MSHDFEISCTIPATPEAVCEAWFDTAARCAMTGGEAAALKGVGFVDANRGPTITVENTPAMTRTELTPTHRGVPVGQTSYEVYGSWEFYYEPMEAYFEGLRQSSKIASTRKVARSKADGQHGYREVRVSDHTKNQRREQRTLKTA